MHKIMRILAILIGIVLVFNILTFLFGGGSRDALSKSIFAEDIIKINVTTDRGDIQIAPHDGEDVRVHLEAKGEEKPSKSYKLTVKEKNDVLLINAKMKTGFFSFRKLSLGYTILVELPSKQYEQLQVQTNVANIYIDSIQANETNAITTTGSINLIDIGGVINATVGVGDVTINLQNITNNITAKSQVGNVIVKTKEAPLALQTEITNSIGNTTINLPNEVNGSIGIGGPQVNLDVEVGNISLSLTN